MGATEKRALDVLVRDFGAQVRVSYEISSTRLHAKAWLFHRSSGFNTAYIGSSNLSKPALVDGLEWNVRLAEATNGTEIAKFSKVYDSYWSSQDFEEYDPDRDADRLTAALGTADIFSRREHSAIPSQSPTGDSSIADKAPHPPAYYHGEGGYPAGALHSGSESAPPRLELVQPDELPVARFTPYPHQRRMLETLEVERRIFNRHRNLIVAATGTGKTVVAALDYLRLSEETGRQPTLLFVAHRKEILSQARYTYRAVLGNPSFGELFVGGEKPVRGTHVFASIQSITRMKDALLSSEWEVIVVDEFHHAEAETYQRFMQNFSADELLGLTATPERADGVNVSKFFGGKAAAELRLWDALNQDLLCPFHYYGISDETDLTSIKWSGQGYDTTQLSNLYTGNDARAVLVLRALNEKVLNPQSMRALGFCVTIEHAEYMARWFADHDIPAISITSGTSREDRERGVADLKSGRIKCIFTVDVFNEGVDIPEVDVVLMLRPTYSSTIYIQQLGRGLRRSPGKPLLTVLDFVGHHRADFDLSARYMMMTGQTRRELADDLAVGYPTLPGASRIVLDEIARKEILDSVQRATLRSNMPALVADVRSVGAEKTLVAFLEASGRTLDEVYRADRSWHTILLKAKGQAPAPKEEHALLKRLHRLRTVDDLDRIENYTRVATAIRDGVEIDQTDAWARMLIDFMLPKDKFSSFDEPVEQLSGYPSVLEEIPELMEAARNNIEMLPLPLGRGLESLPLRSHARYQREELLSGLKWATLDRRPGIHREGVLWAPEVNTDLFLINLHKDEKTFSETTRYRDIPVTKDLFDWESQSTTRQASPTGRRYITHRENGTNILLAVRNAPKDELGTAPFLLLGTSQLESYEGERPIRFRWRLDRSMPAEVLAQASVIGA
ncbi:helicase [Dietzia sp. NCCP-2495]|nr:helicase [Dietzia sp. NCCP-2495]